MEVGGWVQVSLGIFFCGKSFQNCSKPVLIFWSSIQCVFCYTLLKVVNYYDLSVLSMSVMGFGTPKKEEVWICELYPSLFWIFRIFLTCKAP